MAVSFTESVKPHLAILRSDYNHAERFLLGTRALSQRDGLQEACRKCSDQRMPWDFWLIFLFLAVAVPWRGQLRLRKLLERPQITTPEKLALYAATIAFQWLLLAMVVWRSLARGLTPRELGLGGRPTAQLLVVGLLGALLLGVLQGLNLRRIGKMEGAAPEFMRKLASRILPHSMVELLPYFALAVTAGVCEEFVYRGFAMAALAHSGMASWAIVLLSSILFGLAHAYQGRSGILGTGVLGILFAVARILYRSLLPVMIWHTAVDLVAGMAGPRYLHQASEVQQVNKNQ